jgi:spore coat protein A
MFKKKSLLALTFTLMLMLSLLIVPGASSQVAQTLLPGSSIPQFVDPLPSLHTIIDDGSQIELHMTEFQSNVLPSTIVLPGGAPYAGTWVWGYRELSQSTADPYIGPVIVATRGNATEIKFVNDLGNTSTTNVLAYKNSTDQTLHWADPLNNEANVGAHEATMNPGMLPASPWDQNYSGPIPAAVHLHGGEVPPVIDGGPDSWFTSDGNYTGHGYYSMDGNTTKNYTIYRYPNTQEAASIWFHDHTLGATRLNVYAGLAGAYLIVDPNLNLPANLPGPADIVPLVIQDRSFDTNGQLFLPSDTLGGIQYSLNPQHPYWVPEFVGDTIVVNGKAWPYKTVDPKRYRFLFLNGSNARTYELSLPAGVPMWVIGTDGGYLDSPVTVKKLVMQPGERYDVIIDFAPAAGKNIILTNTARTPYPKGAPPQGSTVGRIIQFRVNATPVVDASYNPALGTPLRTGNQTIVRLVNPATGTLAAGVTANKTRELTLNEVMGMPVTVGGITYPGGPTEILVNNTMWDGMRMNTTTGAMEPIPGSVSDGFGNYLTELPNEGDTEVWEIVNLTADAHPIHLHLVQFQLISRQDFDLSKYSKAYNALFPASVQIDPMTMAAYPGGVFIGGYGPPLNYNTGNTRALGGNPDITPYLKGKAQPPAAYEAGWKDTVIMYPGQVTKIAVRWAPTDKAITDPNLTYPFDPNAGGHGYVWHCHIIDHEDNEMMRPDQVVPNTSATRTYVMGINY